MFNDKIEMINSLRKVFIENNFLRKSKNNFALNYHKKELFEQCKIKNNWKEYISNFSSEDELLFYICKQDIIYEKKFCKNCGKELSFEQIKNGRQSCSKECMIKISHSEEWSKRVSENWKNKSKDEKEKIKQKLENTMMERYGVKHNWAKGDLREKEKETWKKKYGVDHPLGSKEIRNKIKNTKKEKYGDEFYTNRNKAEKTMIEKYGKYYNNPEKISETWQNKSQEEINERTIKIKETCLRKYGSEIPWYTQEKSIEKRKQTCLKKYGVEHWSASEEIKKKKRETCKKHFGVDSPFKSEIVLNTCRNNNLKKYGVEWPCQTSEYQSKIRKFYKIDDLKFDSKYEVYFYIYNKYILKNDISKGRNFNYEFNDKQYTYVCDFYVNGINVEIKGSHLFKDGTLYYPYRNNSNWEIMQEKWNKKYECLKQNNVKLILTDSDEMNHIIKIIDEKYTEDFVKLFNTHEEFPYPNEKLNDISDMGLIHHFHKSIYLAKRKGKPSPVEAWNDKNLIKEIALNRLKYVGKCTPSDIIQGFNVTLKAPKVSVFSPILAKNLLDEFLSESKSICDPFSGFSGRMLGSYNSEKIYYGWDINEDHVRESNEIINYIGNPEGISVEKRDILENYERKSYDALFTCPPYGGKEHWNEQNDEIEKSCDEWIKICLNKFNCKKYLFVVDETEKYKKSIVKVLEKKTHFGNRTEYVVLINKE